MISADGRTLASVGDDKVRLWNIDSHSVPVDVQPQATFHAHPRVVTALDYSPDGSTLLSGDGDGVLRLWNAETAKAQEPVFTEHERWIRAAAFLPNGVVFIDRTSSDGAVHLWRATGESQGLFTLPDFFGTAEFSPDGRTLASVHGNDTILLWDLATGEQRATLEGHIHWIFELAFSPDSKTLASSGGDKAVFLWDVDSGEHRATLGKQESAGGRRDDVFGLAFSPDGKTLASSGVYGPIQLWDVDTLQRLSTLRGHTGEVNALAFSPDGGTLASGGWDGTILLWKLASQPAQVPWDANGDGVVKASDLTFIAEHFDRRKRETADVNADGIVNILDLTFVASRFGQDSPDLNGDGIVNILDSTFVANRIGE